MDHAGGEGGLGQFLNGGFVDLHLEIPLAFGLGLASNEIVKRTRFGGLGCRRGGSHRIGFLIIVEGLHAFIGQADNTDGLLIIAEEVGEPRLTVALAPGEAAGLVVRLPGGFTMYHAGDTTVFGDMKIIGELYKPDPVCLPIGGHFTMGPREAAYAIRLLGVYHVIPMHHGTFPVLTGTPDALRELTQDIAGLEIHALKPGESKLRQVEGEDRDLV